MFYCKDAKSYISCVRLGVKIITDRYVGGWLFLRSFMLLERTVFESSLQTTKG